MVQTSGFFVASRASPPPLPPPSSPAAPRLPFSRQPSPRAPKAAATAAACSPSAGSQLNGATTSAFGAGVVGESNRERMRRLTFTSPSAGAAVQVNDAAGGDVGDGAAAASCSSGAWGGVGIDGSDLYYRGAIGSVETILFPVPSDVAPLLTPSLAALARSLGAAPAADRGNAAGGAGMAGEMQNPAVLTVPQTAVASRHYGRLAAPTPSANATVLFETPAPAHKGDYDDFTRDCQDDQGDKEAESGVGGAAWAAAAGAADAGAKAPGAGDADGARALGEVAVLEARVRRLEAHLEAALAKAAAEAARENQTAVPLPRDRGLSAPPPLYPFRPAGIAPPRAKSPSKAPAAGAGSLRRASPAFIGASPLPLPRAPPGQPHHTPPSVSPAFSTPFSALSRSIGSTSPPLLSPVFGEGVGPHGAASTFFAALKASESPRPRVEDFAEDLPPVAGARSSSRSPPSKSLSRSGPPSRELRPDHAGIPVRPWR